MSPFSSSFFTDLTPCSACCLVEDSGHIQQFQDLLHFVFSLARPVTSLLGSSLPNTRLYVLQHTSERNCWQTSNEQFVFKRIVALIKTLLPHVPVTSVKSLSVSSLSFITSPCICILLRGSRASDRNHGECEWCIYNICKAAMRGRAPHSFVLVQGWAHSAVLHFSLCRLLRDSIIT